MTTTKGFVREVERGYKRVKKEQLRQDKIAQKEYEKREAKKLYNEWNFYITDLITLHDSFPIIMNWKEINNRAEPIQAIRTDKNEIKAKIVLEKFKPNFFHKIFKLTESVIGRLKSDIVKARLIDEDIYNGELKNYDDQFLEWETNKNLSKKVLDKDVETYKEVMELHQPFTKLNKCGSNFQIGFAEDFIDFDLHINNIDIIPDFMRTLTSTGKLSEKDMPKKKQFKLYQDHICSSVLRIANECFAILPIKNTRINALSELVNPINGNLENQVILSVFIPRITLQKLNLKQIDPSEAMKNFNCEMKFNQTSGFSIVSKVDLPK